MQKKILILTTVFTLITISFTNATWEGNAGIAKSSDFSTTGLFAKSDMFPKNTIVEIINLETEKKARVIIVGPAQLPGLVALVSPETAEELYFRPNALTRVRISIPPLVVEKPAKGITNDSFNNSSVEDDELFVKKNIDYVESEVYTPESLPEILSMAENFVEPLKDGEQSYLLHEPSIEVVLPQEELVVDQEIELTDELPGENEEPLEIIEETILTPKQESIAIIDESIELIQDSTPIQEILEVEGISVVSELVQRQEKAIIEVQEINISEDQDIEIEEEINEIQSLSETQIVQIPELLIQEIESVAIQEEPVELVQESFETVSEVYLEPAEPLLPPSLVQDVQEEAVEIFVEKEPVYVIEPQTVIEELPYITTFQKNSYYIQVATYKELFNAQEFVHLYSKRYPIAIQKNESANSNLLKIFIGPVEKDEYGAVLHTFKNLGFKDAFVKKIQ